MVEPLAVAQALTSVVRINPTLDSAEGGWLADLRGFDGPEQQELSDLLRGEGVGLGDRSKLRRLATVDRKSEDDVVGIPRRAQQADGREDSATNAQLKQQQENHAGTAQPSSKQADSGSGLSGDSASPCMFGIFHSLRPAELCVEGYFFSVQTQYPRSASADGLRPSTAIALLVTVVLGVAGYVVCRPS
jgi:hypothetical protein